MRIRDALAKMMRPAARRAGWNTVVDAVLSPVEYDRISLAAKPKMNVESERVTAWLKTGGLAQFVKGKWHAKKGLEFFFSSRCLAVGDEDVVLDAAGGRSLYLEALKRNGHRGKRFLNDHIFSGTTVREDGVTVVGGDVSAIHLENESVDKIACHHAFEHFQFDKDTEFVQETFRLLKPGGVVAIVPLFLADTYAECWNISRQEKFDSSATLIVDETASIPGGDDDGHFARIYDIDSLNERVILPSERLGFGVEVVECEVDGEPAPNMKKCFGSALNCPLRVLVLRK